jgi:hypothetical protein
MHDPFTQWKLRILYLVIFIFFLRDVSEIVGPIVARLFVR